MALMVLAVWPTGPRRTIGSSADEVHIAAAASLADVLERLGREFERSSGIRSRLDLASSGLLRAKIEAGAVVDVFLAAAVEDMDRLAKAGRLAPET